MQEDTSHIAYVVLLNIQWAFIGVSALLAAYDVGEYFRTRKWRYISYAVGRLCFALLIGIIGLLLARQPRQEIPWTVELVLWIVGLVGIGQSVIMRLWELRQDRILRSKRHP